jgi:phytanoyl-CoA hydroxylase
MQTTLTQAPLKSVSNSSTSIKKFFDENGYYVAKGVFSPKEVRGLEEDFDRIISQLEASKEAINARWTGVGIEKLQATDTVVVHTHNPHLYSSRWNQAIQQNRFLKIASSILGPDVLLHHTKLFQKPAEKGAPFPMHQDWSYFPTGLDTMIAGIIHVSRADDEMGCLRVYPGSHKLGRVQDSSGSKQSDVLDKYPLESSRALEAEPGDVTFFHYFTLHGSKPNRSQEIRKTVLVQLYAGNDWIEQEGAHTHCGVPLKGWNHRMHRSLAQSLKFSKKASADARA